MCTVIINGRPTSEYNDVMIEWGRSRLAVVVSPCTRTWVTGGQAIWDVWCKLIVNAFGTKNNVLTATEGRQYAFF